jgi:UPF0755 protein
MVLIALALKTQAPVNFPVNNYNFHIEKGTSLSEISDNLKKDGIIKSPFFFKATTKILSWSSGVLAGDYIFTEKENVFEVSKRLVSGDHRQSKIKVTIPEGTNVSDMAFIFLKAIPNFNTQRFIALAKKEEGYLYPDTYNFFANTKPEEIIKTMKDNFDKKIKTIQNEINASKKSLKDIVIMASIVEKEASLLEDRKIIAGVLWKRIDEGMLMQVDPPFYYITGKTSGVTYKDLDVDSPYNTYKNKGLPIGPIANPSLDAIIATINPIKTKYYFYLTGKDGKMYYAETYDGHLTNKNKYLK